MFPPLTSNEGLILYEHTAVKIEEHFSAIMEVCMPKEQEYEYGNTSEAINFPFFLSPGYQVHKELLSMNAFIPPQMKCKHFSILS